MKNLILFAILTIVNTSFGQLSINQLNTNYTIDFTGYAAAGFQPVPEAGQLSSNSWALTGTTAGDLEFGGTKIDPNTFYTRGLINGPADGNGLYAINDAGNIRFLIQATSDHFTPGNLSLRIVNNTTSTITSLNVSYNLYVRNDQVRSNFFNFAYSSDHINYIEVPSLNYISPTDPDALGLFLAGNKSTTIEGLSIAPGAFFYIRWFSDDISGSGQRDEFALDDIVVSGISQAGVVADPTGLQITPVSQNALELNWNKNTEGDDVLIAVNSVPVFGTPNGTYNPGDSITGGGSVIYKGDANTLIHDNLSEGTRYFYKIWSFTGSFNYSSGIENNGLTYNFYPQLFINEFMALNTTIEDPTGAFEDWIEIYNPGNSPVDISGWYITDNLENRTKYKLPEAINDSLTIPANGFMLLWADNSPGKGVRHLNWALSRNGESIGLFGPDGQTPVDSLSFGYQFSDTSYARTVDGGNIWDFFSVSTPGASNAGGTPVSIREKGVPEGFYLSQNYPNPFNPATTINFSIPAELKVTLTVYNTAGEKVSELVNTTLNSGNYSVTFDASNLTSGIYYYKLDAGSFSNIKKFVLLK
ncbi:MAG: lamin tail domain-containing protein [Ignavibacteriaceae bacterium]|nr:lamin tail domain-containing protein [Ignavibacteriaceae bacterium]